MKEFSIEQKAKAYDEVREKIAIRFGSNVADEIFSQFEMSEDERIRKELIKIFEVTRTDGYNVSNEEAIAWLEKQGEQKSIWHNEDEEPQIGSLILLIMQSGTPIVAKIIEPHHTFNHGERWAYIDDLLEKQGEQKPAETEKGAKGNDREIPFSGQEWSEEDNLQLQAAIDICKSSGHTITSDWLKSIKDKIQPKQEWSEEDEAKRNALIGLVEEIKNQPLRRLENWDEYISWLKSLRPQKQWKPSGGQMSALSKAIAFVFDSNSDVKHSLESLYNELKKL